MTPAEVANRAARIQRQKEIEQLELRWQKLIEEEDAAFQYCRELHRNDEGKNKEKSDAVRRWWQIVNAMLSMFTRTRGQYDFELAPFPGILLMRLAITAEELSNGVVPEHIEDARINDGGRPRRFAERHHIAFAVLYVEAVRDGSIKDRSPNKTVREAYGVTREAVQKWVREREEICVGVPRQNLSPDQLKARMLECAKVYRLEGRGLTHP